MTNDIEATVALCKCGKTHKVYGVRFEKAGKKQFVVPYLMSSHPGSGISNQRINRKTRRLR